MTCTEENWPRELGQDLQRWEVKSGSLQKAPGTQKAPSTKLQHPEKLQ
jgi:hypothetical protein